MIKSVSAVIGANYGDEGKGKTVEYLSKSARALVVRFNGGAQAGHTVQLVNGTRHVFHHFGAGTLQGAATFLSEFFLSNPMVFIDEWSELVPFGVTPRVFADPLSPLTTPYDMMLNRASELQLGFMRNGSCGMGINETVHRNTASEFVTRLGDILYPAMLKKKLQRIREEWVPFRMKELRLNREPEYLRDDNVLRHYLEDCNEMKSIITLMPWEACLVHTDEHFEDIIFEGAQGLLLDELSDGFPHVTRSRTGVHNVQKLMQQAGIKVPLDVVYVTRPYVTRHGAGPLRCETKELPPKFEDKTNVPNLFQGELRFGTLDVEQLAINIGKDFSSYQGEARPSLSITCIDHMGEKYDALPELADRVHSLFPLACAVLSRGPTRNDVTIRRY